MTRMCWPRPAPHSHVKDAFAHAQTCAAAAGITLGALHSISDTSGPVRVTGTNIVPEFMIGNLAPPPLAARQSSLARDSDSKLGDQIVRRRRTAGFW